MGSDPNVCLFCSLSFGTLRAHRKGRSWKETYKNEVTCGRNPGVSKCMVDSKEMTLLQVKKEAWLEQAKVKGRGGSRPLSGV